MSNFLLLDAVAGPAPGEQARNGHQDDGADHGHDQAFDIEAVDHVSAEQQTRQPAADDGAQNTENDVAYDAVAATTHEHAGDPACEQSENNPTNNRHLSKNLHFLYFSHSKSRANRFQ